MATVETNPGTTPTGAVSGKFFININGDRVYFSQGNLQFIGSASTPYWKFADNQWDYLGTTTGQNSGEQNVDRDLFGWGTSGYNHGAVCYLPWSTSMSNNSDYYAYGESTYNLYDQTGQADWGYNAISNGGNTEGQWRTLTSDEWDYLFNGRPTLSGIRYAKATVNGVSGVILLPNDWDASTYDLNNANGGLFADNTITADDWTNNLEANGAVFLPAAGRRTRNGVNNTNFSGHYWSSSYESRYGAYSLQFYYEYLETIGDSPQMGYSVRLVHDEE